jgi:hypothetical protein
MKTAVEQLRIELIINSKVKETLNGKVSFTIGLSKFDELFKQAKELEKQQIMKAVYDSMGTNLDPNIGRAEQYYNETYNNK